MVWRKPLGPIEFRPALDGDLLVASLVDGRIVALTSRDGSRALDDAIFGASPGEPLAIGGRVYVGTGDKLLLRAHRRLGPHRGSPQDRGGAAPRPGRRGRRARLLRWRWTTWSARGSRRGGALRWQQGAASIGPGRRRSCSATSVIVPGYVEAPLPALRRGHRRGGRDARRSADLLVALPVFTTLPDEPRRRDRDHRRPRQQVDHLAADAVAGPVDSRLQPLTALPGEAVPIPPAAAGALTASQLRREPPRPAARRPRGSAPASAPRTTAAPCSARCR